MILISAAMMLFAELFCVAAEKDEKNVPVYKSGDKVLVLPSSKTTDFSQSVVYTAINFRWNNSQLDPWYKGNDEVMKNLASVIDSLGVDRILSVEVVSQSSPEGSADYNNRLSEKRAKSMYDYMRKTFPELVPKLSVNADGESWAQLRTYVTMDTLLTETSRNKILEVLDADISVNLRKNWMQTKLGTDPNIPATDKNVYQYLLREYYPLIRNSAIFIGYKGDRVLYFGPDVRTANAFRPLEETKRPPMERIDSLPGIYDGLRFTPRELALSPRIQKPLLERRHMIAVRTNLIRDAFYMPQFGFAPSADIQFEYYPRNGHYTANVGFTWSNHKLWDKQKFFQIRDLQLELRRYFKGQGAFVGPYVGIYGQGAIYGIGLGPQKGWQGEAWGGGLDLGWVLPLNRKGNFRMEFNISAGYLGSVYDPYVYGNPVTGLTTDNKYYYDYVGSVKDFVRRNHLFTWFGPTNIGVSLTYDIIYRKR